VAWLCGYLRAAAAGALPCALGSAGVYAVWAAPPTACPHLGLIRDASNFQDAARTGAQNEGYAAFQHRAAHRTQDTVDKTETPGISTHHVRRAGTPGACSCRGRDRTSAMSDSTRQAPSATAIWLAMACVQRQERWSGALWRQPESVPAVGMRSAFLLALNIVSRRHRRRCPRLLPQQAASPPYRACVHPSLAPAAMRARAWRDVILSS